MRAAAHFRLSWGTLGFGKPQTAQDNETFILSRGLLNNKRLVQSGSFLTLSKLKQTEKYLFIEKDTVVFVRLPLMNKYRILSARSVQQFGLTFQPLDGTEFAQVCLFNGRRLLRRLVVSAHALSFLVARRKRRRKDKEACRRSTLSS